MTSSISSIPNVLTIAGSDSGGGAGIQADIKSISATGSYACSVITALTAQNTQGVQGIYPVSPAFIGQQLDAVFNDIDIAAVKIGMLNDADVITVIAEKIRQYQPKFIILDPVMVATSGDRLIQESAIEEIKTTLMPLVDILTPNLPEALILLDLDLPLTEESIPLITQAFQTNPSFQEVDILLKGGHLQGALSQDWLIEASHISVYSHPRILTTHTHGTGCSLSSAFASYLAQGFTKYQAFERAKIYLSHALEQADKLTVGRGAGPIHHFYALNQNDERG